MKYCIINPENIIENIIVADEKFATSIGAQSFYEGALIGKKYCPPIILTPIDELDSLIVNQEYRIALLELGINDDKEGAI